eukprot:CFRG4241T1
MLGLWCLLLTTLIGCTSGWVATEFPPRWTSHLNEVPLYNNTTVDYVNTSQLAAYLKNASDSVVSTHYVMVMVYAEWCPYSLHTRPTYEILSHMYPHIPFIAVDVMAENANKWVSVVGVPSIMLFNGIQVQARYVGTRELVSLKKFVSAETHHPTKEVIPSHIPASPVYTKPSPEGIEPGVGWALFVIVLIVGARVLEGDLFNSDNRLHM